MDTPRSKRLSEVDRQILKVILIPGGRVCSNVLAAKLGLPRSTIQRRRKYLEKQYLQSFYTLDLKDLGYRRIDLLIYVGGGNSIRIAQKLLERDEAVCVGTSIGEHTIDLRAEVIVKDNSQLLDLLEEVKAMPGVKDVIWSEIVQVLSRKMSIPTGIIDNI